MPEKIKQPVLIGITGQLSTGKSTVAAMFAQLGAGVINADLMAHHAIRPKGACYKAVLKAFGPEIVKSGLIDRQALADQVFQDSQALKKLEGIIHPQVMKESKKEILKFKKAGREVIVLDVPLLFESGMDRLVDYTLTVKANAKVQRQRLEDQGRLTLAQAKARMKRQWSMTQKIAKADLIIDNNLTLEKTQSQVNKIWDMLKRRKENEYAKNTQRKK